MFFMKDENLPARYDRAVQLKKELNLKVSVKPVNAVLRREHPDSEYVINTMREYICEVNYRITAYNRKKSLKCCFYEDIPKI